MSAPINLRYRAFLSYSHADTPAAKWLHTALERFTIGKDLVGRETSLGPIPKTLRPIFRDRDEFAAGAALAEQTIAALDQSLALIVLCSPASAKSYYVNEEVRLFKSRHPDRHVIPVIASGKPGSLEAECFPPAVRFEVRTDGIVTDHPVALLAADLQDMGDGKDLAIAKVVARLTGVATDEIFARAERERKGRQRRLIATLSAAAAVFALIAGVAVIQLYRVETARLLSDAQLLSRRQPTEALMALAEVKDRWLADKSLLPQFSPELVNARLTLARHSLGRGLYGASWMSSNSYTAVADGTAHIWSVDGRQHMTVPGRRATSKREREDYGDKLVPIYKAWTIANGSALATLDKVNCLRVFTLATVDALTKAGPENPPCLNAAERLGETIYVPGDAGPDGTIALAREGKIEILGKTSLSALLPAHRQDKVKSLAFGGTDRLLIEFADGVIGIVPEGNGSIDLIEGQDQFGHCADGWIWGTATDGTLVKSNGVRRDTRKLSGKAPWVLSRGCTLYFDGNGDLYRLDQSTAPLKAGVADAWQYGANARNYAFSKSGRFVAVSTHEGRIAVHDLKENSQFDLLGHTQRLFTMDFDDAESHLLTTSLDGTVRVFSLSQRLITELGSFKGAAAVYSDLAGGPALSTKSFNYVELSARPATQNIALPWPLTATPTPVSVWHDWRIGENHVLADGDTMFVAICKIARCPDGSVVRELRADFVGSGGNVNARASAGGDFLAIYDDGRAFSVFDLRRPSELPVLTLTDEPVTSLAFDAQKQELYLLRDERLAVLPFGPREVADRMAGLIGFCLTSDERQQLFGESGWMAGRRVKACDKQLGLARGQTKYTPRP